MSNVYSNLICSASATAIAEFTTLPICTLKTNYQNTTSNSIINTAANMYKENGVKAFYKASFPAIGSQMISTSSKYVLYRYLEDQNFKYSNKVLNGLFAGLTSTIITHPLDSIKIHLQMNTPFISELKTHGFKLFYRGYSKTLGKIFVSSCLFFPLYDMYNNYFKNKQISNTSFWSSFASGFTSTLVMHPIDYMKTRQIYGLPIFQGWNPKNYYKGLTLNLMRVVPHFIIVMTTIDYLQNTISSKI